MYKFYRHLFLYIFNYACAFFRKSGQISLGEGGIFHISCFKSVIAWKLKTICAAAAFFMLSTPKTCFYFIFLLNYHCNLLLGFFFCWHLLPKVCIKNENWCCMVKTGVNKGFHWKQKQQKNILIHKISLVAFKKTFLMSEVYSLRTKWRDPEGLNINSKV